MEFSQRLLASQGDGVAPMKQGLAFSQRLLDLISLDISIIKGSASGHEVTLWAPRVSYVCELAGWAMDYFGRWNIFTVSLEWRYKCFPKPIAQAISKTPR